jgi:hypothetical protein
MVGVPPPVVAGVPPSRGSPAPGVAAALHRHGARAGTFGLSYANYYGDTEAGTGWMKETSAVRAEIQIFVFGGRFLEFLAIPVTNRSPSL